MRNYADIIKRSVPMMDAAVKYGLDVDRRQHKALCPFHADKKPSMHIYDGKRGWYCFVCSEGGDVIDFVQRMFGVDFIGAEKKLNSDFGLLLPIDVELTKQERLEAERIQREREQANRRKKNKEKQLWTTYHAAFDRWVALDIIKREEAPKTPLDGFGERYIYAAKNIDGAWAEVECALDMLHRWEQKEG